MILQHASSTVFQKNYLSRYITADTQAAYRSLKPQIDVLRAASGLSRTIDPKRPQRLNKAQRDHVDRRPELKLLLRTIKGLEDHALKTYNKSIRKLKGTPISEKHRNLRRDLGNNKKRLRKAYVATHIASRGWPKTRADATRGLS